jgi:hypothetical protein
MKTSYEIIITNNNNETVLDVGAESISSINALQNILKRHKDKLDKYDSLNIVVMPQQDKNN